MLTQDNFYQGRGKKKVGIKIRHRAPGGMKGGKAIFDNTWTDTTPTRAGFNQIVHTSKDDMASLRTSTRQSMLLMQYGGHAAGPIPSTSPMRPRLEAAAANAHKRRGSTGFASGSG